jgi:DUF1016 N-terminal domain
MAKHKKPGKMLVSVSKEVVLPIRLLEDLRLLIGQTREGVAQAINSALVLVYWQIGHRIRADILKRQRAAYGEEIVATLSRELSLEFGRLYLSGRMAQYSAWRRLFRSTPALASREEFGHEGSALAEYSGPPVA